MNARVIDGKVFAARLTQDIAQAAGDLAARTGTRPGLGVVLVGEDAASQVYVRTKTRQAEACGFHSVQANLAADASQAEILAQVEALNADPAIHGILVQLPLPKGIDADKVTQAVRAEKDVDGFHYLNIGRLGAGKQDQAFVPCTPAGCMMLLRDALGADLSGRHAVILGRSNIVGKPMAQLLLAANCTVTIAHSRSADLPALCRAADILVAAVGRPELVRGDWIKPGAVVIDVGINRLASGGKSRLVGDVAYDEAAAQAQAITPVPGGVGPMTIACLLLNTLRAAHRHLNLPDPAVGTGTAFAPTTTETNP
ncbi:methylenetetrahydrofolate dehydrogenase (NADP+) / methenyltetrahydrofolate cyclohydrolase [Paracoccus thiocyanatus]|uniref:Bifunctional protein FolD n=1 Tax=Paracoccus thiocyanatus TaxID=34006 RepID=A0A1N6NAC7_9RHOB|nr:bifunctional methylenetetrahydrofolate dehydrogenase/methenyltetrahydrofolate cyclohydrolase FolD [Paracoccus thiocyanatus]SIP89024.1 methylenetetrahydrofolate dehydrogenase (NADP+) / methenyltetrahydrofolate cyclohydrolase [Paracoccus thiocyanatus]